MFGTNDDNQQSNDDPAMLDNVKQLVNDPATQIAQPQYMSSSAQQTPTPNPVTSQPIINELVTSTENTHPSAFAEPAQGFSSGPMPEPSTIPEPPMVEDSNTEETTSDNAPITAATATSMPADPDHLAGMKQQALDHLEPLVAHLDQSPEEAFKTTMMMIQANDNHTLLEKALDEAKKIEDDKVRANAMLDIINEINYFSQNNNNY